MANFALSALLEARVLMQDRVQREFNQRQQLSQIFKAFMAGQPYVTGMNGESLEALKQATTQATSIKYLTRLTSTITTAKTCTPNGDFGDSGKVDLTWAPLVATQKFRFKTMAGNEYAFEMEMANRMFQMERDIFFGASGLESVMLAYLEAQRTQVNALSAGGFVNTWNGTPAFKVDVALATKPRFYNQLMVDMAANNYNTMYFDIHNTGWLAEIANYRNQGGANATNTQYQFENQEFFPGMISCPTNLIVPSGYAEHRHYIVPEGGVAALFWNDPLNRANKQSADKIWTTQESMLMPGVVFDVFIKESCADTTNQGGSTQDLVVDMEFAINYSLTKQPLDTANETPIFKYENLTS
jgi:hypothetical protein